MGEVYKTSGVFTTDLISIIVGIIIGIIVGINSENICYGILTSLIMPAVIFISHIYAVKTIKIKS